MPGGIITAAFIALASGILFAQTEPAQPQFEVASIKPVSSGAIGGSTFQFTPGGGLTVKRGTLKDLIETGYDVRDFEIDGGPGWINSDRYDITAKSAAGAQSNDISETRRKVQALLAARFQLKVHRETKELPVYELTVAKGGPKLIDQESAESPANSPRGIRRECGRMTGTMATMANLTLMLSRQLSRPVLDKTQLTGKYKFVFDWTPDSGPCGASPDGPSIFTSLRETLGLKLESTKGPVEVIVVDHAEKAEEN